MKKLLSILLAGILLLLSFAACSTQTENAAEEKESTAPEAQPTAEGTEETEETAKYLDSMPEEMNFEDRDIKFYVVEGANGNITVLSVYAEEDTGEVVDSAVFARNLTVSERLKVKIGEPQSTTDSGAGGSELSNAVKSGSADIDIFGGYQYFNIVLAAQGLLFNLNNSENFPYNDFDREYWGTSYMNNMSLDGQHYYWATGDLALRYTGGMYVTYVNTNIFRNYYNDVNLYSIVDEGSWTMDKIREISSGVYQDLNANGKKDNKDMFGFVLQSIDPTDGMAAGCMVDFSSRDDDGHPYITLDNERTYAFWDKYYALMFNNDGTMLNPETDDSIAIMTNFGAGQYMMTCNKLFQSPIYLRDMEDNFMILPLPKLNVEQPHYNTRIHDSCTIFGVPVTVGGTDCISAVLEALASESFKVVTPAYYEIALKVKFTRDSDSGRMIELVHENVTIDFAAQWSNKIGDINHFFRKTADAKSEAIASMIQKNQKVWNKSMDKLVQALDGLSE